LASLTVHNFNFAVEFLEPTKDVYNSEKLWTNYCFSLDTEELIENPPKGYDPLISFIGGDIHVSGRTMNMYEYN